MKMNICSYYSEIDYADNRFNGTDGLYEVEYFGDINLKDEITKAYKELTEKDIVVNELSVVLDYLIGINKIDNYEYIPTEIFDCDYGNFKED